MLPLNLALIILNVEHREHSPKSRFAHLWQQSSVRICADGAANRLYDSLDETHRCKMLPDLITGDLDSLRPDVADFYGGRGVPIEAVEEQDTHDFEKCLQWLQQRQQQPSARQQQRQQQRQQPEQVAAPASVVVPLAAAPQTVAVADPVRMQPFSVIAYGAFGGRLDHLMANLNMLYSYECFERFCLVSDESLAFLLRPGSHSIEANLEVEDGSCGLIPLGGRCDGVVTSGCADCHTIPATRSLFSCYAPLSAAMCSFALTVHKSRPTHVLPTD